MTILQHIGLAIFTFVAAYAITRFFQLISESSALKSENQTVAVILATAMAVSFTLIFS